MTLFETLFYYYTLFDESDDYVSMRKGIQELLDDAEYLKSLQHSVDSSVRLLSARIGGLESQLKNFDETEDIFNRNLKRGSGEIFWDFMSELGVSGGSMAICPIDQHNSVRKQDEEQTENILRTQKRK